MNRASGSGVFARDPDAMIDLIQIPLNDGVTEQQINKAVCDEWVRVIKQYSPEYYETIPYDDFMSRKQMGGHLYDSVTIKRKLNDKQIEIITQQAELKASQMTAWRVDMTLREFPKPQQTDIWFNYPIHTVDTTGVLADIPLDEESSGWRNKNNKNKNSDEKEKRRKEEFNDKLTRLNLAFSNLEANNSEITMVMLRKELNGLARNTLRDWISMSGQYEIITTGKNTPSLVVRKSSSVGVEN